MILIIGKLDVARFDYRDEEVSMKHFLSAYHLEDGYLHAA